jgi:hypothetical protein
VDLYRRHDARVDLHGLERILHRQRVHDRREHAHVISGDAIHPGAGETGAAENVASADDYRNLDAEAADLRHFRRDTLDQLGIDPVVGLAHQGLAGKLQQYASVKYRDISHGCRLSSQPHR